ncbi:hypothetical protein NDU88_006910 [Pleurodeles waltl]|uniref:Uncharacterized protein n=1 Tax=Pleurodeles waltl TaxID=8319 RepID=A0AAV7VR80_PLEWA|nr:hypothetical protein NDU88_006910 [Pleurodeles waltl]
MAAASAARLCPAEPTQRAQRKKSGLLECRDLWDYKQPGDPGEAGLLGEPPQKETAAATAFDARRQAAYSLWLFCRAAGKRS